jgi:hypothetical protein
MSHGLFRLHGSRVTRTQTHPGLHAVRWGGDLPVALPEQRTVLAAEDGDRGQLLRELLVEQPAVHQQL